LKKEIHRKEWLQSDGCGCVYWKYHFIDGTSKKVLEKCELHKKHPNAFGGILAIK